MQSDWDESISREALKMISSSQQSEFSKIVTRGMQSLIEENVGWASVYGGKYDFDPNFALQTIKSASVMAKKLSSTPLVVRAKKLRNSYMLGSGINISVDTKTQSMRNHIDQLLPVNLLTFVNDSLVDEGNAFLQYDFNTRSCKLIPLVRINGLETDPNEPSFIRYVRTIYVNKDQTVENVYVPTHEFLKRSMGKLPKALKEPSGLVRVEQQAAMHIITTPKPVGQPLGLPMTCPASLWIMAYYEYLTGSMDLFKALVSIAWKIQVQNQNTAKGLVKKVQSMDTHGASAISTDDVTLTGLGVPSSQVNFNNARPVAGMVSAVFGVPLAGLLTDVGTSGTNNSLQTLDTPMIKGFELDRAILKDFMSGIYENYTNVDVEITFPVIIAESETEQLKQVLVAAKFGSFHRDEIRKFASNKMGIQLLHDSVPEAEDFTLYMANPLQQSNDEASNASIGDIEGQKQVGIDKESDV